VAANWSDESFRKMSMKVSIWGTEGRIDADRQEVQVFCRNERALALGLNSGWNVRHTTELTEEVWYYLRGEEYSAQMEYFFAQIHSGRPDPTFSFSSAVQADEVIHQIERIAAGEEVEGGAPPVGPRPHKGVLERVLGP
jgi:scyllo-inositol 2-dehydrogenase (NADP+)